MKNNCELIISKGKTEKDYIEEIKDCSGLFVRNEPVTAKMMDSAPKLKVISKHGIGYDNIDIKAAIERNIQVVYAPLGNVNSVAEHALMLILNCAKRMEIVRREFRGGNFDIRYTLPDANEISNKTLGLIGLGNIASILAKKVINGLDMKVIAYDPYKKPGITDLGVEILESKEELLKRSDFVSIHMPLTNETRGSIGMNEFEIMKNSAFIINTSRGDIIREDDLLDALKKGIIKGAGLDVYEQEPIDKNHPLLQLDNVIATPHISGMTVEASNQLSLSGAMGIVEVLQNKDITWSVNRLFKDKK
jgi:D-3-phosphoglycerate dehydrogenase